MIKNFEKITEELSVVEKFWLGKIMEALKRFGKSSPILSDEFCRRFNIDIQVSLRDGLVGKEMAMEVNGVRLRKMVSYIRSKGLLPVIATSNGYFVSYDKKVIESQILSLEQRARSIQASADGLKVWRDSDVQFKMF